MMMDEFARARVVIVQPLVIRPYRTIMCRYSTISRRITESSGSAANCIAGRWRWARQRETGFKVVNLLNAKAWDLLEDFSVEQLAAENAFEAVSSRGLTLDSVTTL